VGWVPRALDRIFNPNLTNEMCRLSLWQEIVKESKRHPVKMPCLLLKRGIRLCLRVQESVGQKWCHLDLQGRPWNVENSVDLEAARCESKKCRRAHINERAESAWGEPWSHAARELKMPERCHPNSNLVFACFKLEAGWGELQSRVGRYCEVLATGR